MQYDALPLDVIPTWLTLIHRNPHISRWRIAYWKDPNLSCNFDMKAVILAAKPVPDVNWTARQPFQ